MRRTLGIVGAVTLLAAAPAPRMLPWGSDGHRMAARAATGVLPADMPGFFRDAADQLVYLDPEPDRWRERSLVEMDQAWQYDHYIDLENVPESALQARDRFTYLEALYDAGLEKPERDGGFLPFRIVELYERLVTEWRLWRTAPDATRRGWIEQRIVNDAGLLGHYVTDGSQPQHTTIHFNGWAAGTPNPEGFTTDRTFHARFETDFVRAHVTQDDVSRRVRSAPPSVAGHVRPAVIDYLRASNAEVTELYRLDRDHGFYADRPASPETVEFASERLAAGARMLAELWWSAWLESADQAGR